MVDKRISCYIFDEQFVVLVRDDICIAVETTGKSVRLKNLYLAY